MQAPWPFCVCAPKRTVSSCVKKSTGMRSSCSPIWNENLKRAPELAASISDANSVSARLTSRPGPMIARSQVNQGSSLWSFLSFLFGSSDVSSVFDFEVASPEGLLVEALAPIIVPLGSVESDQMLQEVRGHKDLCKQPFLGHNCATMHARLCFINLVSAFLSQAKFSLRHRGHRSH